MWLPLRSVLEFLGRSVTWLAVVAALALAAAALVTFLSRRPLRSAWLRPFWGAVLGALLGASLADRFGLPEPLVFLIWRRDLPLAWTVGGALLGAAVALWWHRVLPRRNRQSNEAGLPGPAGKGAP